MSPTRTHTAPARRFDRAPRAALPVVQLREVTKDYGGGSVGLERASLRWDLEILASSLRMVLTGHGLYRGETGGWREPPRAG